MGRLFDPACFGLPCVHRFTSSQLVCVFFFSAFSGCMNVFSCEFFMYGFFQSSPFTFPVVHPLKVNGPWKVYYPQNRNPGYSVNSTRKREN